ncbi:MAG: serine/threonine protein kinase, partial [Deltaproteobacteria bacterium]|nr:serine/threonine protein kinase [Deltaproteobacteria bacterium]
MIGESVGNFEIVAQLGQGGMGEVWLAEQKSIKTRVAIKVLRSEISKDVAHVDRFFGEAVAVSKIRHAGIVKIFDCGYHTQGQAYLVMELLEGETLTNRIRRVGRLPLAEVCDLGRQIASVLDATHAAGVTHRDLKPDNVFLVPDAELASGERVKILDFGIAKLTGRVNVTATAAGAMGTPQYMSPEQWKSAAKADHRTDAYSLGCVVFEMMTGRPPFLAESIGEACAKHLSEAPPLTSSLVSETPFALDELIARLLDKEAANRPTMREAMAAFGAIGGIAPTTANLDAQRRTQGGSLIHTESAIAHDPTVPQPARTGPSLGGPPTTLGSAVGSRVGLDAAPPRR